MFQPFGKGGGALQLLNQRLKVNNIKLSDILCDLFMNGELPFLDPIKEKFSFRHYI